MDFHSVTSNTLPAMASASFSPTHGGPAALPRQDVASDSFEGDAGHYSDDMDSLHDVSSHSESSGEAPDSTTVGRECAFCGASQTPMWRRGPGGKGTLCNACGVKWVMRRRNASRRSPGSPPPTDPNSASSATAGASTDGSEFVKAGGNVTSDASNASAEPRDVYWCKYCNLTWPLSYFKNRQQFGAHCSNCSRKRKSRDVDFGFIPEGGQPRPERPAHRRAADSYSDMDFETALEHARPDKKRKIVYGNSSYLDDPCDSDTDSTANANNNSLSALLGAVESVLSEEHAMDTVRTEMKRVRHSVMRIDAARKSALDEMERWVNAQLDYLQRGIIPAQQPLGSIAGGSRGVPSFSALDTLSSLAGGNANRDAMQIDSAVKAEGSAAAPDADEASARRQEEETTLVAQETMHAAISLKSAVESALAVQSSAVMDLENLRGKFALMLVDFRQKMAQELSSINEALGTIRSRHNQAQMQAQAGAPGAGGALSPDQLASINQEVHALNIRMQTASQNFQAQYHLLSQHLSDQLDLAKQTLMMQMQHHQKQFEDTLHAEERRLQAQLDAVRMQVVSQMYPHEARLTAASTLIDDTIQRS